MYIPKKYGQSRIDCCPFCGKQATSHNKQGIPVCTTHKNEELSEVKCMCGEWLTLKTGKWGPYFQCIRCGNINFKRALEMSPKDKKQESVPAQYKAIKETKKETTITSDELDFY
jgi:hypothetical protein